MTVRAKIIALVSLGVILPVFIVSAVTISNVRSNALTNFEEQSQSEMAHVDALFSMYLKFLSDSAAFFVSTDVLKEITPGSIEIYADKPAQLMTPDENSQLEQKAFSLMKSFGDAYAGLAYIWLATEDNGYLQWPKGKNTDNYTPTTKGWYQSGIKENKPVRIPAYKDAFTGAPLVDYVHRFEGKDGVAGVFGVDVTLQKLTELLATVKFGGEGYVVMVEDTGVVLADPSDTENNFKQLSEASHPYDTLENIETVQEIVIDGATWFATVYTSPELGWKFIGLVPSKVVYEQTNNLITMIVAIAIIMIVIFTVIGSILAKVITRPLANMAVSLTDISQGEGDLTQRLNAANKDEAGKMALAFNQFVASIDGIVGNTKRSSSKINDVAQQSEQLSSNLREVVSTQVDSINHVSTAFNEMVATANEVASNCSTAATSAENSEQEVRKGNSLIQKTMDSLKELEEELNSSNESMMSLSKDSDNIVSILNTIKAIAEQTNLLALNAAIEAARAGEQGRGFAVVADEVRTLAARTAESTDEIDKFLTQLQQQTNVVAKKMEHSVAVAHGSVDVASQTYDVFSHILSSVQEIKDMMIQISAAAEEQHAVADEINQNVVTINDGTMQSNTLSEQVSSTASALNTLSSELQNMVARFKSSE